MSTEITEVLFVDLHDAGRTQLARALMDHCSGGRARSRSAGITPAAGINPDVVRVLAEWGIQADGVEPTQYTDAMAQSADIIVTMGCGDRTPNVPGKRHLDWDLPDPDVEPFDTVRLVRDDLDGLVRHLADHLQPADPVIPVPPSVDD
jgi:protein-tyrosine-phosphatase